MTIDDKTKISLYAVGAALPFVVGAILWLSSVATDAQEAKIEVKVLNKLVLEINDRTIRIEERLTLKEKHR